MEDGLRLVEKRGALMEEACAATAGSMAALVAGTPEAAVALAQECDVDVANFNCPGQIVLSGSVEESTRRWLAPRPPGSSAASSSTWRVPTTAAT